MIWNQVTTRERALLSKDFYVAWKEEQLKVHYTAQDLSRWIRRQVRMDHVYTFGTLLELRGKAWNKRRPWQADRAKFSSFLWYLESLCAQSDRHEMRTLVRYAIERYEGEAGKGRRRGKLVSFRKKQWSA